MTKWKLQSINSNILAFPILKKKRKKIGIMATEKSYKTNKVFILTRLRRTTTTLFLLEFYYRPFACISSENTFPDINLSDCV